MSAEATPSISVVVPIHDELDNLEPLHAEIDAALAGQPGCIEVIYVDDGSTDGSGPKLQEIAKRDDRVRVLHLDGNHGQSAALDAGFKAVRGAVTVTLDGDLQNDPADIPRMLAELERADMVNGVRTPRQDSLVRRASSRIGNGFRNWATGESVTDVGCSLRVIRSSALEGMVLYQGMHRFLPTLLRIQGARVTEIPVRHRPRRHGRSKYGIGNRLWVGVADVLAVRWMKSRALRYRVDE